jgi:hypothetical protein
VEVQFHAFLTSALDEGELSASRIGAFTPGEKAPCTHLIGGWVGPKVGLDAVAKRKKSLFLPGIEPLSSSQLLTALTQFFVCIQFEVKTYVFWFQLNFTERTACG